MKALRDWRTPNLIFGASPSFEKVFVRFGFRKKIVCAPTPVKTQCLNCPKNAPFTTISMGEVIVLRHNTIVFVRTEKTCRLLRILKLSFKKTRCYIFLPILNGSPPKKKRRKQPVTLPNPKHLGKLHIQKKKRYFLLSKTEPNWWKPGPNPPWASEVLAKWNTVLLP